MLNRAHLPDNIDALKALLSAQGAQITALKEERQALRQERDALREQKQDDKQGIIRLTLLLDKLRRMVFGQKSEKLARQIDQLQLELEELHINQGERAQKTESAQAPASRPVPQRRPLPEHLPREVHEHLPNESACPDCGGAWKRLGEDVSEVLEHIPASFRIVRHVRPRLACNGCDRIAQAPAPSRPIARSVAGPGLLSHVMVSKYLDHQPLYRQCQIYERENVSLSESTVGDWVGGVHQLLRPLLEALRRHVFGADKLHTDDTPIKVLAPGTGKTRQARLWVYARDDRPSGDTTAPAVWLRYSTDRSGIHPQTHLKDYTGILQADAFAGYDEVYKTGRIIEAACWAHARRGFYDIHVKHATPITTHVLDRIAELYKIESDIRGSPPEERREVRQKDAKPIVTALHAWLREQLPTVSRKSKTAEAIGYAMNQWQALIRYLNDGRIEIDNNAAHAAGGMSGIMSPSGTCRLEAANPYSYSVYSSQLAA